MTIKRYPYSGTSKEEDAQHEAIVHRVAAEFKAEFAAMMRKYKAEICIRECNSGYQSYAEGFDVEFDGIHEDGETVRPYFTVQFGTNETPDSIAD